MAGVGARPPVPRGPRVRPRRQHAGVYSSEHPDPAPDVVTVARESDGVFRIQHFENIDAPDPCCLVEVTQRAGEDDVATLLRASALCDRKHAEQLEPEVEALA